VIRRSGISVGRRSLVREAGAIRKKGSESKSAVTLTATNGKRVSVLRGMNIEEDANASAKMAFVSAETISAWDARDRDPNVSPERYQ
jgi:hypothetical protein